MDFKQQGADAKGGSSGTGKPSVGSSLAALRSTMAQLDKATIAKCVLFEVCIVR